MDTKDIILELRTKQGLSQEELAEKVFVTRQAVSRWENGDTKPHPHDSTLGESSREAQSGRRLLGTNGVSLWLWCCLPQPGALGP